MLVLVGASGGRFRVMHWGLQGLGDAGRTIHTYNPAITKPDGTQLWTMEAKRRHTMLREAGPRRGLLDPDFRQFSGGFCFPVLCFGGSVTFDHYGRVYAGLNVGMGGPPGLDASAFAGRLAQDYNPDAQQLQNSISGFGVDLAGGYYLGGGLSVDDPPYPDTALYGFTLPGAAVSASYTFRVY